MISLHNLNIILHFSEYDDDVKGELKFFRVYRYFNNYTSQLKMWLWKKMCMIANNNEQQQIIINENEW